MSMPSPEKQERHGHEVAVWQTSDLMENFVVMTTLPHDEPRHRAHVLELIDSDSRAGGDLVGQCFFVSDFVIHLVPFADEHTGEVRVGRRIVFPQPDGLPISFGSEGVVRSLPKLAWACGREPPWDPPIKVLLKQRNLRGGHRTYTLIYQHED
jgi:hypothetical protein